MVENKDIFDPGFSGFTISAGLPDNPRCNSSYATIIACNEDGMGGNYLLQEINFTP